MTFIPVARWFPLVAVIFFSMPPAQNLIPVQVTLVQVHLGCPIDRYVRPVRKHVSYKQGMNQYPNWYEIGIVIHAYLSSSIPRWRGGTFNGGKTKIPRVLILWVLRSKGQFQTIIQRKIMVRISCYCIFKAKRAVSSSPRVFQRDKGVLQGSNN